jgi:RIO-like serine/threonine protein kinase
MRQAQWDKQDIRILEALHTKAVTHAQAPFMGVREICIAANIGPHSLNERLKDLTRDKYVATTTLGAYVRYYVTEKGVSFKDSKKQFDDLQAKPKLTRFLSELATGPTATVYFKNVSFSDLENVVRPAWEKFTEEIRKGLDKDAEIGFVGTIKRSERKPSK